MTPHVVVEGPPLAAIRFDRLECGFPLRGGIIIAPRESFKTHFICLSREIRKLWEKQTIKPFFYAKFVKSAPTPDGFDADIFRQPLPQHISGRPSYVKTGDPCVCHVAFKANQQSDFGALRWHSVYPVGGD